MTPSPTASGSDPASSAPVIVREAEAALKRFGYSRIPPVTRNARITPEFWVQEAGVPQRTFPVFVESKGSAPRVNQWMESGPESPSTPLRAIVVVPDDRTAEETWEKLHQKSARRLDHELSILVLPAQPEPEESAHWHTRIVSREELLALSTGIVVGMFRQAQAAEGSNQIDFEEILETLKTRFGVDVHASLGVESDPDALFLLYQLALRDGYAPGDSASNLHMLVLRPTGPATRLPSFAG